MDFRTALYHYKNGTASEEERCYIEEELEKAQLIADYLEPSWDENPVSEEVSGLEMKRVRRHLQLRNFSLVLTSLILVFTILISVIQYAIPALEKQYWDPSEKTCDDHVSDLAITLGAYAELFCPTQAVRTVTDHKRGFANYDISIEMTDTTYSEKANYYVGNVEKGILTLPDGIWNLPGRVFSNIGRKMPRLYTNQMIGKDHDVCDILESFPEYTVVLAAISFPEDLNMKELIQLEETYQDRCQFGWIAIRDGYVDPNSVPLCGMKPFSPALNLESLNESYPYFSVFFARYLEEDPGLCYEEHFKSLLRFSIDQVNAGTGLTPPNWYNQGYHSDSEYYENVLTYVEENGVYAYGAYVYATPDALLEMMEKGVVCNITYQDHWIDISSGL